MEEYTEADARADMAIADAHETLAIQRLVQEAVNDGRKLVTVRQIDAIDDIPGADLIKVATIEGWKVVVKANEFKPGDLCVFFEVDTFLPLRDERFAFLEKNATMWHGIRGARLKTTRLRKQLSQGLALPLKDFPEIAEIELDMKDRNVTETGQWAVHVPGSDDVLYARDDYQEIRQMNFTGVVGVMKWEKPMSAGMAKGNFPSFLRKSDQERCQNLGRDIFGYDEITAPFNVDGMTNEVINDLVSKGVLRQNRTEAGLEYVKLIPATASRDTAYEVTIKMDGSSMTVYRKGQGEEAIEGVCSRNLDLKLEGNDNNEFVKLAKSGLLELLRESGAEVALQGELMGPGIQGNRESFSCTYFLIYNVFDIRSGEFLTPPERHRLISALNAIADDNNIHVTLEHVPVLFEAVTLEELGITNMDELLKFAEGPSLVNPVREGVVFKAVDGKHQFKVISNQYLLEEK